MLSIGTQAREEVGVLVIVKLGDTHPQEDKLLATNGMRQPRGEGERAKEVWTFLNFDFPNVFPKKSLIMFPMIFHNILSTFSTCFVSSQCVPQDVPNTIGIYPITFALS